MTLIVGFPSPKYVVLGSDSEATGSQTKGTVQKIANVSAHNCTCFVGGAGNGDFIDFASQEIARTLSSIAQKWTVDSARTQIEGVVTDIYNTRIDALPPHEQDSAAFILLVAIAVPGEAPRLVKISRGLSVYQGTPIAVGSGQPLARYLIATLHSPDSTERHHTRLAAYIIAQAKRYAPYCGGPTDVVVLRADGTAIHILPAVINIDEETTQIAAEAAGVHVTYLDPIGWGWDLSKIDGVIDGMAETMKKKMHSKFDGLAASMKALAQSQQSSPQAKADEPDTPHEGADTPGTS